MQIGEQRTKGYIKELYERQNGISHKRVLIDQLIHNHEHLRGQIVGSGLLGAVCSGRINELVVDYGTAVLSYMCEGIITLTTHTQSPSSILDPQTPGYMVDDPNMPMGSLIIRETP